MKATEAAAILTIAAAYDNRKPDADQAKAWAMALDGLKFEDCREVVVAHYRKSREWLMPVDVISGVKKMRSARVLKFGALHNPPPEVADDPSLYARWHHDTMTAIGDGRLEGPTTAPAEIEGERRASLSSAGRSVADVLTDDPANARAAARRAMQDGRQAAKAKPEPRPTPAAACEAQTTDDDGEGVSICGLPATGTAQGDLRDYPACDEHTTTPSPNVDRLRAAAKEETQ